MVAGNDNRVRQDRPDPAAAGEQGLSTGPAAFAPKREEGVVAPPAPHARAESHEKLRPTIPAIPAPEELGSESFRAIDRMRAAWTARATAGLSPAALSLAWYDWFIHLAFAPGKQLELANKAARKAMRIAAHAATIATDPNAPPCIEPLVGDNRFSAEAWKKPPFCMLAQAFLLNQQWWHNVTHEVPGVAPHHEEVVSFCARQALDMVSPSNFPFLNPEVIARTVETGGMNFVDGFKHWAEDTGRLASGQPPVGTENFVVGKDVAVTPGKVVYRNHLIELIQYAPTTETVFAEPVLLVPAWIMKYYILDLSPENSLIRYLVGKGHTVFCVSWRNPTEEDRNLSMDDYRRLGVMAALDVVSAIVPNRKIHATGYCLGGTLLAVAAAAMARAGDARLASMTMLAAQTDFTEPGELAIFIDDSELHLLEGMMWERGYLSADQMAGAFQLLRTNDLIWSRVVRDYLMGERAPMFDLMAWNADSTRMPYRMHSEYLRRLYLDNELAAGRFMVDGRTAALQNIRAPMFVVGTERDHVAPWRSVYKIHYLSDAEVTFALTSGGHNAGIVSEPGRSNRYYRIATKTVDGFCLSPNEWAEAAEATTGSWWEAWSGWLAAHSSAERVPAPAMGSAARGFRPIENAPGSYVLQR
jgi:polyhydroxyalkanoate synthase